MKNFPSKRGSRDNLAREHICQSSAIRPHHSRFANGKWTFSDHVVFREPRPQTSSEAWLICTSGLLKMYSVSYDAYIRGYGSP
jgi:hypothetical protein